MILPNKLYLSYCYTRLSILNRSPFTYTMYYYKSIAEIAETVLECFKQRFSSHHHPISYERVHPVTSYYTTHPWIHSTTFTACYRYTLLSLYSTNNNTHNTHFLTKHTLCTFSSPSPSLSTLNVCCFLRTNNEQLWSNIDY